MLFHMLNQGNLGIQRFARIIGRAVLLATSAANAGIQVKQVLPAKVLDVFCTEGLRFLNVVYHTVGRRFQITENIVERTGNDMPQLGEWDQG